LCCDWETIGRGQRVCFQRFQCNNLVGSPVNCLIQGGYQNGGSGVNNDLINRIASYGNLTDACQAVNNRQLNGWNLTLDDCTNYRKC
ncbi:7470_t:CDS:1, partial [Racocetra persica]